MKSVIQKAFGKRERPRPVESAWSIRQLKEKFPEKDEATLQLVSGVESLTMTSPERILAFCDAVDHVSKLGIPGDIVECGVWRGGSMVAAINRLKQLENFDRTLWLYDTFEGMSEPTDRDRDFLGREADVLLNQEDPNVAESIWCRSGLAEVQANVERTGYPAERVKYVVGKVEETLTESKPDRISVLRLDTDWYESTKAELEHLYPRLSQNGILIIDDYGHWGGCRQAVDEYFADNKIEMFLHRIDYTGRIGVKVA